MLHRIQVERDTLDREEKRAAEREAELKARLEQVQKDAEREDHAIAEAREVLARFDREEEAIKAARRRLARPAKRQPPAPKPRWRC